MYIDFMCFPKRQMMPPTFDINFPKPSIIHYTAVPPFLTSVQDIIKGVKKTIEILESQPDVKVIRTKEDLENVAGIGVILGLQQPPFDATAEDWKMLKQLGIHITTLSYKDDESPFGAGFLNDGPLTQKGRELIDYLCESNIWLDLSHSGHETARDVIDYISNHHPKCKIIATHTGSYSVYANKRNLPDDVLKGIADHEGIIGIYTLSFGLDAYDDSLIPFYNHVKKVINLCGDECVTIGTDGVYEHLDEDFLLSQFKIMKEKFDADGKMMSRHPVESPELNLIRKDIVIHNSLSSYQLPDEHIKKILFENGLQFLNKNL